MWFGRYQPAMRVALADGRITPEKLAHATETLILGFALAAQAMVPKPTDGGPDRGVLATLVSALQKVQDSLFNIAKKVDTIAADTTVMREQTAQVSRKLDDLARVFEEVSQRGSLIPNPQTPADHYHNARFAEVKADFAMARKSYNAFLASGAEFIDPALAYTDTGRPDHR